MKSTINLTFPRVLSILAVAVAPLVFVWSDVRAEERLTQPVYRVATETTAAQPVAATQPAAAPAAPSAKAPLDFTQ